MSQGIGRLVGGARLNRNLIINSQECCLYCAALGPLSLLMSVAARGAQATLAISESLSSLPRIGCGNNIATRLLSQILGGCYTGMARREFGPHLEKPTGRLRANVGEAIAVSD